MVFLRRASLFASVTLMICIGACTLAESQPPTPTPLVGTQGPQQQPNAQSAQPNNANAPVVAARSQQPAQQPSQSAAPQNQQASANWWDWFTGDKANWAIVFLTFVLAVIGLFQWWATHTANKHNAVIERAYIDMAHTEGLALVASPNHPMGNITARIRIRNHGSTPASVQHVLVHPVITNQPLPPTPPYDTRFGDVTVTSLVKDKMFTVQRTWPWPATDIHLAMNDPDWNLYLIGYTDYTDRFGKTHRAGYARAWDKKVPILKSSNGRIANNLEFVTQPDYNYDKDLD